MLALNTVALAPVETCCLSNSLSVAPVSNGISPAQTKTVPDGLEPARAIFTAWPVPPRTS